MHTCSSPPSPARGVSLIITLIMLVIIGLTAATAMKTATSNERVVNNLRLQNLAQQYAEGALRYCEVELAKPSALRIVPSLKDASITVTPFTAPNWNKTETWLASPALAARVTDTFVSSANSSFKPATLPQCYAERHVYPPSNGTVTVVTSRGFSPDYQADGTTGETVNGSVVWLQSIVTLK